MIQPKIYNNHYCQIWVQMECDVLFVSCLKESAVPVPNKEVVLTKELEFAEVMRVMESHFPL